MKLRRYQDFIILEKFDDNIIAELKRLGVTDEKEINTHLYHAHRGHLAEYLSNTGRKFTFGMLSALFKDSRDAKRRTDIKVGVIKAAHRIIPMALAPFFPIVAIIGYILGTSRAFNKVIAPILAEPGNNYPEFLKKLIDATMRVAEGDLTVEKDRFTRAFVVSDRIVDLIKPEILQEFSLFLSEKMSLMNPDEEVPDHFIENELKQYINDNYKIDPDIPLKENSKYLIKFNENVEKITYSAKERYTYLHPESKSTMSLHHEYFTCRVDRKIVASCLITYPKKSPTKFFKGEPAYIIYAGHEYTFIEKNDKFVMLFDVKAKKTGKGYGKILFDKLVEYLSSKNIEKIYEDVDVENVGAQRFYERLGFESIYRGVFDIRYQLILKNYKK